MDLSLLPTPLYTRLEQLNMLPLTPVQAQSIPMIWQGSDLRVQSPTGSGKTAAYALAILAKLNLALRQPQALVISPSRELAQQISEVFRQLGQLLPNLHVLSLCGGHEAGHQQAALTAGAHVVIGTLGRLMDLQRASALSLTHCQILVLDEADRLQLQGFVADLRSLNAALPQNCQQLWFSATYSESMRSIAPKRVLELNQLTPKLQHYAVTIAKESTLAQTLRLCADRRPTLIFVNTKAQCRVLCQSLNKLGWPVLPLHGDLTQPQREQTVVRLRHGSILAVVATDLASRGLDLPNIERVFHAEPAPDLDTHQQRQGRTARYGNTGESVIFSHPDDPTPLNFVDPPPQLLLLPTQIPKLAMNPFATLSINLGKRARLRKGDIAGALMKMATVPQVAIKQIELHAETSFITIDKTYVATVLNKLKQIKKQHVQLKLLL